MKRRGWGQLAALHIQRAAMAQGCNGLRLLRPKPDRPPASAARDRASCLVDLVLAVHALLSPTGTAGDISNRLQWVLPRKGFLASAFKQVAPMSLPLLSFEHSLPDVHRALLFRGMSQITPRC